MVVSIYFQRGQVNKCLYLRQGNCFLPHQQLLYHGQLASQVELLKSDEGALAQRNPLLLPVLVRLHVQSVETLSSNERTNFVQASFSRLHTLEEDRACNRRPCLPCIGPRCSSSSPILRFLAPEGSSTRWRIVEERTTIPWLLLPRGDPCSWRRIIVSCSLGAVAGQKWSLKQYRKSRLEEKFFLKLFKRKMKFIQRGNYLQFRFDFDFLLFFDIIERKIRKLKRIIRISWRESINVIIFAHMKQYLYLFLKSMEELNATW